MGGHGRRVQLATGAALAVLAAPAVASAAGWSLNIAAGSHGQSTGGALPSAPTGVTATCVSSTQRQVTVSWTASAHVTSYAVYDSTTTATGTYTLIASGITGTSWTSGTLSVGSYWFEIVAQAGANWASAKSGASAKRTIGGSSCS